SLFIFADTSTSATYTLSLHDALPIFRVLTNQRKNLVVNPNTGALASTDALLNFAAGDPNAGTNPQVVQGAYTNSYPGATSTALLDRKSTRLNSSHVKISYAVFCLKKK